MISISNQISSDIRYAVAVQSYGTGFRLPDPRSRIIFSRLRWELERVVMARIQRRIRSVVKAQIQSEIGAE